MKREGIVTNDGSEREIRKQALIVTAGFIADDRRLRELTAGGTICRSHGLAVLITHVNDGEPCSDYLSDQKGGSE